MVVMHSNDSGGKRGMVVVDKVPDCTEMISQLFGKGKWLTHQTPDPLPQSVIEAFNLVSLATVFADSPISLARQD